MNDKLIVVLSGYIDYIIDCLYEIKENLNNKDKIQEIIFLNIGTSQSHLDLYLMDISKYYNTNDCIEYIKKDNNINDIDDLINEVKSNLYKSLELFKADKNNYSEIVKLVYYAQDLLYDFNSHFNNRK